MVSKPQQLHQILNHAKTFVITQFDTPIFFYDRFEFEKRAFPLMSGGFPGKCIFCKQNFNNDAFSFLHHSIDDMQIVILAFSCRECDDQIEKADIHKKQKIQAKGLGYLLDLVAKNGGENA